MRNENHISKTRRQAMIPKHYERLGKTIQDIILQEIDVITESDWFEELITEKIKEITKKTANG